MVVIVPSFWLYEFFRASLRQAVYDACKEGDLDKPCMEIVYLCFWFGLSAFRRVSLYNTNLIIRAHGITQKKSMGIQRLFLWRCIIGTLPVGATLVKRKIATTQHLLVSDIMQPQRQYHICYFFGYLADAPLPWSPTLYSFIGLDIGLFGPSRLIIIGHIWNHSSISPMSSL